MRNSSVILHISRTKLDKNMHIHYGNALVGHRTYTDVWRWLEHTHTSTHTYTQQQQSTRTRGQQFEIFGRKLAYLVYQHCSPYSLLSYSLPPFTEQCFANGSLIKSETTCCALRHLPSQKTRTPCCFLLSRPEFASSYTCCVAVPGTPAAVPRPYPSSSSSAEAPDRCLVHDLKMRSLNLTTAGKRVN